MIELTESTETLDVKRGRPRHPLYQEWTTTLTAIGATAEYGKVYDVDLPKLNTTPAIAERTLRQAAKDLSLSIRIRITDNDTILRFQTKTR